MKASLLSLLSLLLSAFGPVCQAQNWAPFQVNKKILYSTPDSLGGMLVGKSLALIWFDTMFVEGTTTTCQCSYLNKDFLGPYGEPKSFTSLYGSKMTVQGNTYRFYPQKYFGGGPFNAVDTILFRPDAEPGSVILQSPTWQGIVTQKISRIVDGFPDSVKLIQITEIRSPGETYVYNSELSKQFGFRSIPDLFGHYAILNQKKSECQYFGDYDDDDLGIKTFQMQSIPFQTGDVLLYSFRQRYLLTGSNLIVEDSVKSQVISVSGDSCLVVDSIKTTNFTTGIRQVSVQQRKIKNQPLNYNLDPYVAQFPISAQPYGWLAKGALLTKDSVLFIGLLPANLGINDGPTSFLISTKLPLSLTSSAGAGSSKKLVPISFTRGNKTYGQNVNILFTSRKDIFTSNISVFPNPAKEKIRIEGIMEPSVVMLHNLQGKVIMEQTISTDSELDVHLIPNGLFYLTIRSGEKQQSLKWVKE